MKRILLTLMLVLGITAIPAMSAVAQPEVTDQTFESVITGDEIDLGTSGDITFIAENYDFNETESFQEEFIWWTYDWSNFQYVLVTGPVTTEEYHDITLGNMESFYETWEVLDEEINEDHSWFIGEATLDGNPLIVYYEFHLDAFGETDQVLMQFTDASAFVDNMEYVQAEVTVGGDPLISDVDAGELADSVGLVTGGGDDVATAESDEDDDTGTTGRSDRGGSTDDDASTPESDDDDGSSIRTNRGGTVDNDDDADVESTPESDDADDDGADSGTTRTSRTSTSDDDSDDSGVTDRADRGSTEGQVGNSDDDDDDATAVAGGDWESMGLVSDSEWESPTHGDVITWDTSTWEFPTDYEEAIYISEDPPYDVLTLQTTDGLGYVYVTIDVAGDATPRSMVEWWSSPEYAERFEQGMTLVETSTTSNTASVVYETTNTLDQSLFVVIEVTFLEDGTMVFSQISAAPDTISDVYGQYLDGVELNGGPIETTWTVEDVAELSGN